MILPATVPPESNPNPVCVSTVPNSNSVNAVATTSDFVSTTCTCSSSSTAQKASTSSEAKGVVSCSESCSGHAQSGEVCCKDSGSKRLDSDTIKPESKISNDETEDGDFKKEGDKNEEIKTVSVKSEGDGVGKKGKEREVIVLDDSLDDDFKQTKKRFRTPATNTKDGPVSCIIETCRCYCVFVSLCIYVYLLVVA